MCNTDISEQAINCHQNRVSPIFFLFNFSFFLCSMQLVHKTHRSTQKSTSTAPFIHIYFGQQRIYKNKKKTIWNSMHKYMNSVKMCGGVKASEEWERSGKKTVKQWITFLLQNNFFLSHFCSFFFAEIKRTKNTQKERFLIWYIKGARMRGTNIGCAQDKFFKQLFFFSFLFSFRVVTKKKAVEEKKKCSIHWMWIKMLWFEGDFAVFFHFSFISFYCVFVFFVSFRFVYMRLVALAQRIFQHR